MKSEAERYQKTIEILSKFSEDAKERFRQDALFHQVVQVLVRTDDPYKAIEQLVNIANDCQNALNHHLMNCCNPLVKY
jgi:hypothetical protein